MKQHEKLVAAQLLRLAAERFSSHCCNDFHLEPTLENHEMAREMFRTGGDPDREVHFSPDKTIIVEDFVLMHYLADRLEGKI